MNHSKFEPETITKLQDLVAKSHGAFPSGFSEYNLYAEERLTNGHWPGRWIARSPEENKGADLAQAVLEELKILICQNDSKYRDVASSGRSFAQKATIAVGGYITARYSVEAALATSMVAASMLLVVRVGRESFCRALGAKQTPKR
jgi:hypothetical protein